MGNSTNTKSAKTDRNGRFNLPFGISIRPIIKAIKHHAAATGMVVLALSTACAPITRTAHVNTDQFVVNVDPESITSNSDMSSKLQTLSDGQRLAVDMSDAAVASEPEQITFQLGTGVREANSEIPAEILASVASELGIMSGLADDGVLLASAGNLFGETGGEIHAPVIAHSVTDGDPSTLEIVFGKAEGETQSPATDPSPVDDGLLLASAENLFAEAEGGIQSSAFAQSLASIAEVATIAVSSAPSETSASVVPISTSSSFTPVAPAPSTTSSTTSDDTGSTTPGDSTFAPDTGEIDVNDLDDDSASVGPVADSGDTLGAQETVDDPDDVILVFTVTDSSPDDLIDSGNDSSSTGVHADDEAFVVTFFDPAHDDSGNSIKGTDDDPYDEFLVFAVADPSPDDFIDNSSESSNTSDHTDDEAFVVTFFDPAPDDSGNSGDGVSTPGEEDASAVDATVTEVFHIEQSVVVDESSITDDSKLDDKIAKNRAKKFDWGDKDYSKYDELVAAELAAAELAAVELAAAELAAKLATVELVAAELVAAELVAAELVATELAVAKLAALAATELATAKLAAAELAAAKFAAAELDSTDDPKLQDKHDAKDDKNGDKDEGRDDKDDRHDDKAEKHDDK